MKYHDGITVRLGDIVRVPIPSGTAEARIVMLGENYEHLDIDAQFLSWVKKDRVLEASDVVLEWVGINAFAHDNPAYAPVGNYMFSPLDEHVVLLPPNHSLQALRP